MAIRICMRSLRGIPPRRARGRVFDWHCGAIRHCQAKAAMASEEREPEYASGDLSGYNVFHHKDPFPLSTGTALPEIQVAYESWGTLNTRKDNVILLQCGMSASSHAHSHTLNPQPGWWEEYIGPGKPLDTNLFHVICTNNLGSCYGSTGPSSLHPADGRHYGSRFPRFRVDDMVAAQFALLDHLNIQRVHACVGASLGGMLSLCSAARYPDRVGKFVSISACAKSFPGSIAFRHAQRQAIMSDPNWNGGDYYSAALPESGLKLARQIGTITYRSGKEWNYRFGQGRKSKELVTDLSNEFLIEHYLAHQGQKWVNNYDPNSLLWISKAMDGFSVERPDKDGQPSIIEGLRQAMQPALVIGVQHDVLFPVWQQQEMAHALKEAGNKHVAYYELDSMFGHDAFLLESTAIGPAVKGHLEQEPYGAKHLWEDMANSAAGILQVLVSRGNSADSFRDIFRTLAGSNDVVETYRLKEVVKLVFQNRIAEATVDRIFLDKLHPKHVRMEEFVAIRELFLRHSYGTEKDSSIKDAPDLMEGL